MRLDKIQRMIIPVDIVDATCEALREAGRDGFERFVLWSGRIAVETAEVSVLHVPTQTSYKTEHGLIVRVEGQALHDLNKWLFENGKVLLAQVHAHPTDAFHSDTDDTYPIVTAVGGFSIVVPDFARNGVLTGGTKTYRLTQDGWLNCTSDAADIIEVVS